MLKKNGTLCDIYLNICINPWYTGNNMSYMYTDTKWYQVNKNKYVNK